MNKKLNKNLIIGYLEVFISFDLFYYHKLHFKICHVNLNEIQKQRKVSIVQSFHLVSMNIIPALRAVEEITESFLSIQSFL